MFCEKCGRKIRPGSTACRECGHEVTAAEYCGGFWGLSRENPEREQEETPSQAGPVPAADDPVTQTIPVESEMTLERRRPPRQDQRRALQQKRADRFRLLPYILCGILVIVSFVQLMQIHGMRKTNHELKSEVTKWRKEAQSAKKELEEVTWQEEESEDKKKEKNQKDDKNQKDTSKDGENGEDPNKEDLKKEELEKEMDFSESKDAI